MNAPEKPLAGDAARQVAGRDKTIDPKMLELLACPLTKGPLTWDPEKCELVSKLAKLAYPVRDGIPVMLPSEARQIEP
jgi:uncharacterized protein YbaR (Trm112 family)